MANNNNNYNDIINRMMKRTVNTRQAVVDTMNDAGDAIVLEMKRRCPVDTGALQQSIHQNTKDEGNVIATEIYADAKNKDGGQYWYYVEYGTGIEAENGNGRKTPWTYQKADGSFRTTTGQKAHHFVRPSVAKVKPKLVKILKSRLTAEVDEV